MDCSAFYPSVAEDYNFSAVGIPFLRVNEIVDGKIIFTDATAFLPASIIKMNRDTIHIAHNKDILIAKGGNTAGKVGYLSEKYPEYATCRDVVILRTGSIVEINPLILAIYLSSKYGKRLIEKTISQTGQPHLTLYLLERLPIPLFSDNLQNKVSNIENMIISLNQKSIQLYSAAEGLLKKELGLSDWRPTEESVATKTFSDFKNSGRLDAEYYQPKYDEIAQKIASYKNGMILCCEILVNAMIKLNAGSEYCYLELADIGKSGEIISCTKDVAENLPSRARQKVRANDVIVSSVEGSLPSCALITEDYNNAICSTGFYLMRSSKINPETLLLLMKSAPIQALLKKGCSGTILTAILPDALKHIELPLIRQETQTEIAAKIQESFALRKESKRLLDLAKRAVEIAIEQDEDVATAFLREKQ